MKPITWTRFICRSICKYYGRFTLLELLVVVGIMVILMSLLLPSLQKARLSAKGIVCTSNQKQIGQATYNYAQDHNGYCPGAYGVAWRWTSRWTVPFVWEYLGCYKYSSSSSESIPKKTGLLYCPVESLWTDSSGCYGINIIAGYYRNSSSSDCYACPVQKISSPSSVMLWADTGFIDLATHLPYFYPWGNGLSILGGTGITIRHRSGFNGVFYDLHSSWEPYNKLNEIMTNSKSGFSYFDPQILVNNY